jgi:hypothetical protein
MAKQKPKWPELKPKSSPAPVKGFTTQDAAVVKKLSAVGIFGVNCFGQPMTFEYAPQDNDRIKAALG